MYYSSILTCKKLGYTILCTNKKYTMVDFESVRNIQYIIFFTVNNYTIADFKPVRNIQYKIFIILESIFTL
jgi:hypothetical protein